METKQALIIGVLIGLIGGSGFVMHKFFGIMGVATLAVFTVIVVAIMSVVMGGGGGSSGDGMARAQKHSKGARGGDE